MPAQSPTLSPTLSAMVAGLRLSSSGMPASTLPTRSAPPPAASLKVPRATRRRRAGRGGGGRGVRLRAPGSARPGVAGGAGADVGGLREDAAADAEEQGEQGAT